MGSDTETVDTLTQYYGTQSFINWMNGQAKALDMTSTTFADASGVSSETVSTPEDLYRLAVYVANKKSFIWKITRTPQKTIRSGGGTGYTLSNPNPFAGSPSFVGGEVDDTTTPQDAAVSVFSANISGTNRRIAVIVFDSGDYAADTQAFVNWFTQSALQGGSAACVSCAEVPHKKISL
jgi:D-alanyl-D-alanine carboxypeptidase